MKYIKTIKIGEDEIDFSTLKISERVQVIENLPLISTCSIYFFELSLILTFVFVDALMHYIVP